MKIFRPQIISSLFIILFVTLLLTACAKDRVPNGDGKLVFEVEEHSVPVEDALNIVSDLPAYIIPYDYKEFGAALVNRMQNKVAEVNDDNFTDLASVVLHSSQIQSIEDEWSVILIQLLLGHNIIIVEPTIKDFNYFSDIITSIYLLFSGFEEGQELLNELEVIPGARQTLEAFYELSMDPSKIESMFLFNTDSSGVFAEAIAVRGSDFHIVDRMKGVAEMEVTHEQIIDEEGTTEQIEAPNVESAPNSTPSDDITPYTYGLFADMFVKWIDEQEYYVEQQDAARQRALTTLNTRATETTKYNLEDICTVQKVQYTISAATPYDVGPKLPVTVSFEICSIYMEDEDCDYYCVYKNILSYNQILDCGPTGEENKRKWRQHFRLGEYQYTHDDFKQVWYSFPYYGPFMRDMESSSICHAHTDDLVDSATSAVNIPDANSIKSVAGVVVEKYSPKNSIGSVDKTDGFSYGFDGAFYLAKEPSASLGFSVSWDTSTTQTIDDLEIIASSTSGIPVWKYVGHNLPESFYNLFKTTSHSEAPAIMRRECEVDQSWIWRVPNPSGSYRLFDETKVSTAVMYYKNGFFQSYANYVNQETSKRVSFLMMPPPRCQQKWMMNVAPYSEELNSMLATTHSRFWKKDDHEFTMNDSSQDSRITIEQFINDFKRDLNSKRFTWKNRNFTGKFTFSYYNIDDENNEPLSFDFVVE